MRVARLVNGVGRTVSPTKEAILAEASYEGSWTGIVFAKLDDGVELSISQHEDGEWNVTLDHEPVEYFDNEDKGEALDKFLDVLACFDVAIPKG